MKSFGFLLALAALELSMASSALAAGSQSPPSTLHWRCWYDRHIEIICLLDRLSDFQANEEPSSHLPAIVQDLRRSPELFLDVPLHIPLFSPPDQPDFPAQLARATVCGPRLDCTVDFTMSPPSTRELSELLGKDLSSDFPSTILQTASPE